MLAGIVPPFGSASAQQQFGLGRAQKLRQDPTMADHVRQLSIFGSTGIDRA
jgi:hypothetical protein